MQKSRVSIIGALVLWALSNIWASKSLGKAVESDLSDRLVRILRAGADDKICSGVLLDAKTVLTSRHCLLTKDARAYRVQLVRDEKIHVVEKIEWDGDSLVFPNLDQVRITLEKPVKGILAVGIAPFSKEAFQLVRESVVSPTDLVVKEAVNGKWLKDLAVASSTKEPVCAGDSGSPVFIKKSGKWQIFGLITGIWDPLTEGEAPCSKDILISQIKKVSPNRSLPSNEKVYNTILDSCQTTALESAEGIAFFGVLVTLMEQQKLARREALGLFNTCEKIEGYWKEFLASGRKLSFRMGFAAGRFKWLSEVSELEFANLDSLAQLPSSSRLQNLNISGSRKELDWVEVPELSLKSIKLSNISESKNFEYFLRKQRKLEEVTLMDFSPAEGKIDLCWFKDLENLRVLKIGLSAVSKGCELNQKDLVLKL